MEDIKIELQEYIIKLIQEIDRLEELLKPSNGMSSLDRAITLSRLHALLEVKTDLRNILEW